MLSTTAYEARKKEFLAFKDTLVKEPSGDVKKEYYVGCNDKFDWQFIHEELKKDGSLEDNIPTSSCGVKNQCLHTDTLGIYLLTDSEATSLRNHSKVTFVHINAGAYPGTYKNNPDDICFMGVENGGKDIKLGDDKRPVQIVPQDEQYLYNYATGEILVDEFEVPLIAEKDSFYVADATMERATSITLGDVDSESRKRIHTPVVSTAMIYGDYDVNVGESLASTLSGYATPPAGSVGIMTVEQQNGTAVGVGSTSLYIKKEGNDLVKHDEWPYFDVRVVNEQGNSKNKIYVPSYIGIETSLGVNISDTDPLNDIRYNISGKYIKEGTTIHKVSYNSRISLSENHSVDGTDSRDLAESIGVSKDENNYSSGGGGGTTTGGTSTREYRYNNGVRHQRNHGTDEGGTVDTNYLPNSPGSNLLNRGSWQLRRHMAKTDPWRGQSEDTIKSNRIQQYGTGKDVDLIVCDTACWFGHIEFQNPNLISNVKQSNDSDAATAEAPSNYIGGNVLAAGHSSSAATGSCDVLDLILDAPYYLDPDFFEVASPFPSIPKLITRWDGTVVPNEYWAAGWWSYDSTSHRSSKFVSLAEGGTATGDYAFGEISIGSNYTRANCNGSNTALPNRAFGQSSSEDHGTACASQAYGRSFGWAYNANKWYLNMIGRWAETDVDGFNVQRVFHQLKPNRSSDNTKNPTVSSNSWGHRQDPPSSGFYWHRPATIDGNTSGTSYSSLPAFMDYFTLDGDGGRNKSMPYKAGSHAALVAGDNLVNSGVIFVCSSGNNNQKLVKANHPDYNNYHHNADNTALVDALENSQYMSGATYIRTVNRPGYPMQIGQTGSGTNVVYNTILVGAIDDDFHSTGKECKTWYSNAGDAVDVFAAADESLAAACDQAGFHRYDAYYTSNSTATTIESRDARFNGTSSACPVAAGIIATKMEYDRAWGVSNIKLWLSNDVGTISSDDYYLGTEATTPTDTTNWGDDSNMHGGPATVIWDTPVQLASSGSSAATSSSLSKFVLNGKEYPVTEAEGYSQGVSGKFSDVFLPDDAKALTFANASVTVQDPLEIQDFLVDGKYYLTSGTYRYGKSVGMEIGKGEDDVIDPDHDDMRIGVYNGYFYNDDSVKYYFIDKRVNDVSISKSELKSIKSDTTLKIAEQFAETSEVSTTLLGIPRAETQLSLFSNVSSYGLEKKDWEFVYYRGTVSFQRWEERVNRLYGKRDRGSYLEETQESAIKLYSFPAPYTYPFGPNFEKQNLYDVDFFAAYIRFIELGNALYNKYATMGGSYATFEWLNKFLNPGIVTTKMEGSVKDANYVVDIDECFAQIDTWTETWRDIVDGKLQDPDSATSSIGFSEVNLLLGTGNLYSQSSTRPGYRDDALRYTLLRSRRVFRYQPGRISGFTFGTRVAREFIGGFKLEWGIFNETDHYVFQMSNGFVNIVRRSKMPLEQSSVERSGMEMADQKYVISPDPFDNKQSATNPDGDESYFYELVIPQDKFNGDKLNGTGDSGHTAVPENITMWKIEFGWYGAIGARFYAYIPTGNGDARWVVIHTIVIENSLGKPCLVDPFFRFRYVTNLTRQRDIRTPQFVYKYGASYYVDGGDEGTSQLYSVTTKTDRDVPGVKVSNDELGIISLKPKDLIYNSTGVGVVNKKLVIPTKLNISATALTEVKVGLCTACPGYAHVYTPGIRTTLNGRDIFIQFSDENEIEMYVPPGTTETFFRKQDIGAKLIAPSIFNFYIIDVYDDSNNSALAGNDGVVGFNSYTKARVQGFSGHRDFTIPADLASDTRPLLANKVYDRSVSPAVLTTLPESSDFPGNIYKSAASGTNPQAVRLSNYDATAVVDYEITGSKTEIQCVVPRRANNGFDPTWQHSHWGDVLVGVTDIPPIANMDEEVHSDTGLGFEVNWDDVDSIGNKVLRTGIATSVLPNDKILYAEHTHAWAAPDENGWERQESWPVFEYRTRLGLGRMIPTLSGIGTGRCGKVTVEVQDETEIENITYVEVPSGGEGTIPMGNYFKSASGVLTGVLGITGYAGGQVAIINPDGVKEVLNNVVYSGNVLEDVDSGSGLTFQYIKIDGSTGLNDDDVVKLLVRPVKIYTPYSTQMNTKTKIFKYNPFPLYCIFKLKNYGELNNVSIKETRGDAQSTISPIFLTRNCEVNTYGGLTDNVGTEPTNFRSVAPLSGAEFDNQNKSNLRPIALKDVYYVGKNETKTIDLSKVFSQDREVITPDNDNLEANFIIAKNIDSTESYSVIQASLNFKEQ